METDDSCLRWHLRLHLAEGVGAVTFGRLVEHFGGVEAAAGASPAALRRVAGVGPALAGAIAGVDDDAVEEELALARREGVTVLCLGDEAYPPGLRNIPDPPPVLYVRGRLEPADAVAVGVVGSRRCTHYGLEQAERFGGLLGRAGLTVVSGGARGIDTAAPYRDRVVHHALMNVLEPILERHFHPHSYACRGGKGTHAAADRAQSLLQRHRHFVQFDIRKYFPSIDHAILKDLFRKLIKDRRVLALLDLIVDNSKEQEPTAEYFPGDDLFTPHRSRPHLAHAPEL